MVSKWKYGAACAAVVLAMLTSASVTWADPWSFGVMADTQWSGTDPTGNNINTVAVNQARACNQAFVNANVSFVVQVGDLCDVQSNAALQTRLDANSALAAAGIPFYGLRGNHEDNDTSKAFFQSHYVPASGGGATVAVAPFDSTSYSVTYNNTKVVLLDINTAYTTAAMDSATTWTNTQLSLADHQHAFVFHHKNLLGQNHKDNQFGGSNDANPTQQDNFLGALQANGVRYDISGHDHMHHRSVVTSPGGNSKVQELICASDSYKYYTPGTPYSSREAPISQQLSKTGYYVFTVDGPRVTGKYYETTPLANGDVPPNPTWTLSETFGYSLNGREFLIASGGNLNVVQDTHGTTSMKLAGTNGSTAKTNDGRLVNKDVNTGWTDRTSGFASDLLTIWGLEDIDAAEMATPATLTMSYDLGSVKGLPYIEQQNADGSWTPLVSTINGDGTVSATITHSGTYAVTPEPAAMGLLAVGILGLISRRRRQA